MPGPDKPPVRAACAAAASRAACKAAAHTPHEVMHAVFVDAGHHIGGAAFRGKSAGAWDWQLVSERADDDWARAQEHDTGIWS